MGSWGLVSGSLYEGSHHFGSIFSAPDFLETLVQDLKHSAMNRKPTTNGIPSTDRSSQLFRSDWYAECSFCLTGEDNKRPVDSTRGALVLPVNEIHKVAVDGPSPAKFVQQGEETDRQQARAETAVAAKFVLLGRDLSCLPFPPVLRHFYVLPGSPNCFL